MNAIEFRFAASNRGENRVVGCRVANLFAAKKEAHFIFENGARLHQQRDDLFGRWAGRIDQSVIARRSTKDTIHKQLFNDAVVRAVCVEAGDILILKWIEMKDSGIEAPEERRVFLAERGHGRELRAAKNYEEGRVNTFAVPPRLQYGGQLRSLGDEIREFVKDQCEAARALFPGLRLLRGVAQKCIPGDCNFLCCDPLGGERRN